MLFVVLRFGLCIMHSKAKEASFFRHFFIRCVQCPLKSIKKISHYSFASKLNLVWFRVNHHLTTKPPQTQNNTFQSPSIYTHYINDSKNNSALSLSLSRETQSQAATIGRKKKIVIPREAIFFISLWSSDKWITGAQRHSKAALILYIYVYI